MIMPKTTITKEHAQKLVEKFKKIQDIRHRSLEILLRVNRKTSEYKLKLLQEKLEELTK